MGGLLTKLNIIKSNTLVKAGQLLYNCNSEGLKTVEGENIPEGLYLVKSVQLNHQSCEDNKKRYFHNLTLMGVECDGENKLSLKSGTYVTSLDNQGMETSFGIGKIAKKGVVYEYLKDQFEKAGKSGFDPKVDYDRRFSQLAWKVVNRSPIKISKDEVEDMIIDVLMQVVNPKTVEKYDPKRDILTYFSSMFYQRMITEVKEWNKVHSKEMGPKEDREVEDRKDLEQDRSEHFREEDTEKKVHYKELVSGIKNFLKGRTRGDGQLIVFEGLLEGYSGKEISEKNNISPALVTRYLQDLKKSMKFYGDKTNNNDLINLMKKYEKTHTYADGEHSYLIDVLKDYKKKLGNSALNEREVSGEVTKVRKVVLDDKVSDDAIASVVLNDAFSSKALKKDLEEYFSLLSEQDDLIESEGGKLTGLKIISDEVRSVENQAKRAGKEKGFFVYSKCGMGPHKVLKMDGTFSIKLNKKNPVKIFKSRGQADRAASKYQHTKLVLKVGAYPDEFLNEE